MPVYICAVADCNSYSRKKRNRSRDKRVECIPEEKSTNSLTQLILSLYFPILQFVYNIEDNIDVLYILLFRAVLMG